MQDKGKGNIPPKIIELINENPGLSIKEVLKANKMFDYYIIIPQIEYVLNKKKPPSLTCDEENKLLDLFSKVVDQIHEKFPERKQILRYRPILRKHLPMINRRDLLKVIPQFKNKSSIKSFDRVWSQIVLL